MLVEDGAAVATLVEMGSAVAMLVEFVVFGGSAAAPAG